MTITQLLSEGLEVNFKVRIDEVTSRVKYKYAVITITSSVNPDLGFNVCAEFERWEKWSSKVLDDCYEGYRENFPIKNEIKL